MICIYEGNNLDILKTFPDEYYNLIYIDPPFNTGHIQYRKRENSPSYGYSDKESHKDYLNWMDSLFKEAYRILKYDGSFFFHLDYHYIHYCKCMLDDIFGFDNFRNEIIWAYEWGSKSKTRWSCKHDTILFYSKSCKYTFHYDEVDRVPYKTTSEKFVSKEKQERGKTLTDVWWNTIVHGKEKTGYATQKPLAILERIVRVHSNKGDNCLDFFGGSGSFGEACAKHNRNCDLIDINPDAIKVMNKRFLERGYEYTNV